MNQVNFLDIDDISILKETCLDVMEEVTGKFELSNGSAIPLGGLCVEDWFLLYEDKLANLPGYDDSLETWLRISW